MAQPLTYLLLDLIVSIAVLCALHRRLALNRRLFVTIGAMVVLTALFDNVIIANELVAYDWSRTVGLRILYAPIEDFFYPVIGAIVLNTVWEVKRADITQ